MALVWTEKTVGTHQMGGADRFVFLGSLPENTLYAAPSAYFTGTDTTDIDHPDVSITRAI
jgi:hypothetical protein